MKPTRRPANPCFSSGPCAKRPGWSPAVLERALVGRSHRSGGGLARLVEVIDRSRAILGIPADWRGGGGGGFVYRGDGDGVGGGVGGPRGGKTALGGFGPGR